MMFTGREQDVVYPFCSPQHSDIPQQLKCFPFLCMEEVISQLLCCPVRESVPGLRAEPSSRGCNPTVPEPSPVPAGSPRPDLQLPSVSPAVFWDTQSSAPSKPLANTWPISLASCLQREGSGGTDVNQGPGQPPTPGAWPREAELRSQEVVGLTEIWGL